ncbi:hypothetical protein AM1_4930 [Acaryochloris marina MBIC11017]|uniref:Uncharacterized protein n=1 Tax=Acaryochloris marina (strain MBIC 11017) TaxID=329726 RepID=B0C4L8_ACAM1|nr:hypothetical protein AM1_4930 [Acaryochloris marina MBIC11017]
MAGLRHFFQTLLVHNPLSHLQNLNLYLVQPDINRKFAYFCHFLFIHTKNHSKYSDQALDKNLFLGHLYQLFFCS